MTKRGHEDQNEIETETQSIHQEPSSQSVTTAVKREGDSISMQTQTATSSSSGSSLLLLVPSSDPGNDCVPSASEDPSLTIDHPIDHKTDRPEEDNNNNHQNNQNNHLLPVTKKIKLDGDDESSTTMMSSTTTTDQTPHDALPPSSSSSVTQNSSSVSRVVHVRNIPPDAEETDLINLALPFGKISNLLLLRGKNQAMIEFADISSAQCMVTYWQTTAHSAPPTVRGRTVYCQFSNHQQIKSSETNNNNGHHHHHNSTTMTSGMSNGHSGLVNGNTSSLMTSSSENSSVLRVVVDQPLYGVTLDNYHQLFSRCGKVAKIVTFHKNGSMQALIQFESVASATIARNSLDGTSMFGNNHNILRVGFSKLTNLNVKYNNDKSRDYTITGAAAATGDPAAMAMAAAAAAAANVDPVTLAAYAAAAAAANQQQPGSAAAYAASGGASGHHLNASSHHSLGGYGTAASGAGNNRSPSINLSSHARDLSSAAAAAAAGLMAHPHHHHQQQQQQQQQQPHQSHHSHHHLHAHHPQQMMAPYGLGPGAPSMGGTVLLVSSIPEQIATPEALFTLFGVFGDVMRVKVLFAKQDNALIQMSEPAQAALALAHLDKLRFLNKTLHVTLSKHSSVQLPKDGSGQDSGLTRDFSSCSQLHRFKKPGSKNYCNIFPPSLTLHLSNIPASCSEQELRDMFSRVIPASSITGFKFFPRDRKMALVSLASLDDSILALIKLHNAQLAESSHLRVSFSKSSI